MSLTAIMLLLLASVMHAGWNLLSKHEHPSASFFHLANLAGCFLFVPVIVFYWSSLSDFPLRVWLLLVATGFFMALYYIALAGAYRSGDMSIAYPLARSSPVIVVTIVALILGRSDQVSILCVFGIVLVVAGCYLIPMKFFSDFRLSNYLNATCIFALFAAIGTSGYSILDDEALRCLRNSPQLSLDSTRLTIIYACLEGLTSALWLTLFILIRREERINFRKVLLSRKLRASVTGISIYVTYALVLISMAYVRNVSYVVAFRQLSIPLGTILGVFILRENRSAPKFVGVSIMFVGLILVGFG